MVERAQAEARALGQRAHRHRRPAARRRRRRRAGRARVLAEHGATHEALRAQAARRGLDGEALAAIGIDLDEIRRRAEATFGPGALERGRRAARQPRAVHPGGQEGARARAARGDRARRPRDRRRARAARAAARGRRGARCCASRRAPTPRARAARRSARRGVVADAEGDLLVRAGGERLLAGAVGIGLGRQRAARAQPGEQRAERRARSAAAATTAASRRARSPRRR